MRNYQKDHQRCETKVRNYLIADDSNDDENALNKGIPLNHIESSSNS